MGKGGCRVESRTVEGKCVRIIWFRDPQDDGGDVVRVLLETKAEGGAAMDAAMAALCDPGQPDAFDGLVKQLMSPSNEERRHAEGLFAEMRKHADPTALQLVRVIRTSPAAESRGMCAVLLRKVRRTKRTRLVESLPAM